MAFKSFVLSLFGLAPEQKEERELFKKSLENRGEAEKELEGLLEKIRDADQYFADKAAALEKTAVSMRPSTDVTLPTEAPPDVFRRPHPSHAR